MESFTYSYPVKVYFGEKAAEKNLPAELAKVGENVLLAYGGGSIKQNGVYDELVGILNAAGKKITEFTGIMSNPTYAKVQEGAKLARDNKIDFILAVGGGSVIDCCKIVSAQAKMARIFGTLSMQSMVPRQSLFQWVLWLLLLAPARK